jgi:hypothetical protein
MVELKLLNPMNKLYHLNPNNWGTEYFVMAPSKEEALNFIANSGKYEADKFKGKTINNLPYKYTIEEYEVGQVIQSELS